MNWNYYNAKQRDQKENPDTFLNFSKYEMQKPKKVNPLYELRKKIAELLDRPIPQIMGLTKGMTEMELNGLLTDAKAFNKNPQARGWSIFKELKQKRKQ